MPRELGRDCQPDPRMGAGVRIPRALIAASPEPSASLWLVRRVYRQRVHTPAVDAFVDYVLPPLYTEDLLAGHLRNARALERLTEPDAVAWRRPSARAGRG